MLAQRRRLGTELQGTRNLDQAELGELAAHLGRQLGELLVAAAEVGRGIARASR